jgi:hypothetical protein
MRQELAALELLVDELEVEHVVAHRRELALQIYLHARQRASLEPYVARLLTVPSTDDVERDRIVFALVTYAFAIDDGELLDELLRPGRASAVFRLDHREKVGPVAIRKLTAYAASVAGMPQFEAVRALRRLARFGADIAPAFPLLFDALGTPATGRGLKRVQLDAAARDALRAAATTNGDAIIAELEQRGNGNGANAKAAKELLAEIRALDTSRA